MVKLFVEGGGETTALKAACREGFASFVTKAGLRNRPRIVACGSRRDAYDSFCTAIENDEAAMLLVDSEAAILGIHEQGADYAKWLPWAHLKQRDGDRWEKPAGSNDSDCHLMVQVMESWFLADQGTLTSFFGNGFKANKLPNGLTTVEGLAKGDVYRILNEATASCKTKATYDKAEHSFKLLAKTDSAKVTSASRWAHRFISELKKRMDP